MSGSDIRNLHDEGIQVRVDLDPHAQMHHKFCVIDDYILITGSFNWTKQAVGKNQENLVVMDDPVLARMYTEEFNRMWEAFSASVDRYLGGVKVIPPAQPVQPVQPIQSVQPVQPVEMVEPAPPVPENENA
ncbi:hypothetical protein SteCoe_13830 [Stentor coeruleus]|uniref:Mitochondrial cardiolipin hydrolase n=1 Tax=Stentor coeruleus TaxID=5963 RepID=A0A1R2C7E3_9CILI|nr:hypothetical protein SteCoe_13830 [Stentor coeruleus]